MWSLKGTTRVAGIFGWPVSHSLSPVMHNAAFRHLGMDYCYVPFPVPPEHLGDAVKAIRALCLRGVNVTIPHKESVRAYLDELSDEASFIGAVNTVLNEDGRLKGFNTDGAGFMRSLAEAGIGVAGRKVLIIGAGGAARSVGYHLCREGSSVCLCNRTSARAESLASDLRRVTPSVSVVNEEASGDKDFIRTVDIIINTTPLGMNSGDPLPLDASLLDPRHVVCDLIYKETPLITSARRIGATAVDGLGMLLWQGVLSFEIWTGFTPPVEVMRRALTTRTSPGNE